MTLDEILKALSEADKEGLGNADVVIRESGSKVCKEIAFIDVVHHVEDGKKLIRLN